MSHRLLVDLDAERPRDRRRAAWRGAARLRRERRSSWPGRLTATSSKTCAGTSRTTCGYPYGADGARGERIAASLTAVGRGRVRIDLRLGRRRATRTSRRASETRRQRSCSGRPRRGSWGCRGSSCATRRDPSPVALDLVGVSRSLPRRGARRVLRGRGRRLRVLMVISRPRGPTTSATRWSPGRCWSGWRRCAARSSSSVLRPPTLEALARSWPRRARPARRFRSCTSTGTACSPGAALGGGGPLVYDGGVARAAGLREARGRRRHGAGRDGRAGARGGAGAGGGAQRLPVGCGRQGARGGGRDAAAGRRASRRWWRWPTASTRSRPRSSWPPSTSGCSRATASRTPSAAGRPAAVRARPRPSPKGELPLADWVVPVHYRRRDISFPPLATPRSAPRPLEAMLDELRERPVDARRGPARPVGSSSAATACSTSWRWPAARSVSSSCTAGWDRQDRAGQGVRPLVARHRRRRAPVRALPLLRAGRRHLRPRRRARRDRPAACSAPTSPPWSPSRARRRSSCGCCTSTGCC